MGLWMRKHKKFFIGLFFSAAVIYVGAAVVLPSKYVVPILMYHNIDEKNDILSVPPKNFDKQMRFLSEKKYNVIGLGELVDLMTRRKKIPPKTVIITFDDGPDNLFANAYPILKKYNIPATMFVIPNHCGWQGYLTGPQIRGLSENGIEIGSHTLNDVWLPNCGDEKLAEELVGSKAALEKITGKRINFISYPLGGFNQRVRLAVIKAGYKGACATNPGRFSANNDIYALKRLKVSGKNSGSIVAFWFKATGYATWFKEHKPKKFKKR